MFKQYTYEFRKATVLSGIKSKNLKLFLARRNVTERSYFRWLKRYNNEGLKGLYEKSRCPKNIYNQSPDELIPIVLKMSYEGIGQLQISVIISRDTNIPYKISKTGVRNILRRANFLKTKRKSCKN